MPAPSLTLNLIVLRSPDMDHAVLFYRELGLSFEKHAHGRGPEHYASELNGLVFEIYPLADGQAPTSSTRVGFTVDSVDQMVPSLIQIGAECLSPPKDSPWGRRAVVRDFDGHTVELLSR